MRTEACSRFPTPTLPSPWAAPGGTATCLDRLSCRPLNPAKDWLRMMPLGPPGEQDWAPTSMISGSLAGSPVGRRQVTAN